MTCQASGRLRLRLCCAASPVAAVSGRHGRRRAARVDGGRAWSVAPARGVGEILCHRGVSRTGLPRRDLLGWTRRSKRTAIPSLAIAEGGRIALSVDVRASPSPTLGGATSSERPTDRPTECGVPDGAQSARHSSVSSSVLRLAPSAGSRSDRAVLSSSAFAAASFSRPRASQREGSWRCSTSSSCAAIVRTCGRPSLRLGSFSLKICLSSSSIYALIFSIVAAASLCLLSDSVSLLAVSM